MSAEAKAPRRAAWRFLAAAKDWMYICVVNTPTIIEARYPSSGMKPRPKGLNHGWKTRFCRIAANPPQPSAAAAQAVSVTNSSAIFASPSFAKLFMPPKATKPHIESAATSAAAGTESGRTPRSSAMQERNCAHIEMKVPSDEAAVAASAMPRPQRPPP